MFIELRHETTLHIPFREASKVFKWNVSLQQRLTRLLGLAMGRFGRDTSSASKARIRLNKSRGWRLFFNQLHYAYDYRALWVWIDTRNSFRCRLPYFKRGRYPLDKCWIMPSKFLNHAHFSHSTTHLPVDSLRTALSTHLERWTDMVVYCIPAAAYYIYAAGPYRYVYQPGKGLGLRASCRLSKVYTHHLFCKTRTAPLRDKLICQRPEHRWQAAYKRWKW